MNTVETPLYFWITTGIFLLSYVSDYYLIIYAARFFAGHLKDHIRYEGSFVLTPEFQKDVDQLRLVSPNFFLRLFLSVPLLFLVWWLSSIIGLAMIFEATIGGLILREAAIHLRHVRNLALALLTKNGAGITGRIEYARWLTLKLSAFELFGFGGLFLIFSAVFGSWFFFGGAVLCIFTGLQHWRFAKKAVATAKAT